MCSKIGYSLAMYSSKQSEEEEEEEEE
jgi:hypothetical protein